MATFPSDAPSHYKKTTENKGGWQMNERQMLMKQIGFLLEQFKGMEFIRFVYLIGILYVYHRDLPPLP